MTRRLNRAIGKEEITEPTVNLTPLIDVVFVILIMFIVVAPLLELDRIDLAEAAADPRDGAINAQESSPVSIHVRKDNTIQFNQKLVTIAELQVLLKQARGRYPNVRPQLFHDKRAHFGTYQSVKNAAEEAGFKHMDIILKPS